VSFIIIYVDIRQNTWSIKWNGQARERHAAPSLAAPTLELSWATMRPPFSTSGKRNAGEVEPEDLSSNLIVQLGVVTERRFTIPSQIAGLGAASQVFRRIAELEAIAAGGIPVARRSGDRL